MPLPVSLATIAETEAELGVSFSASFKLHMSRCNGGEVSIDDEVWWLFPFRDSTDRRTIRRTAEDIRRETQTAQQDGLGFPADGIAIAHNGSGDLLFLRREGDRLQDEVWVFRLHGGELSVALNDVDELWQRENR
jgi:hypothetical protein